MKKLYYWRSARTASIFHSINAGFTCINLTTTHRNCSKIAYISPFLCCIIIILHGKGHYKGFVVQKRRTIPLKERKVTRHGRHNLVTSMNGLTRDLRGRVQNFPPFVAMLCGSLIVISLKGQQQQNELIILWSISSIYLCYENEINIILKLFKYSFKKFSFLDKNITKQFMVMLKKKACFLPARNRRYPLQLFIIIIILNSPFPLVLWTLSGLMFENGFIFSFYTIA